MDGNLKKFKKQESFYNPNLRNKIPKTYVPWLIILSVCVFLNGVAICQCAVWIKILDSVPDELIFHIWVGVPMLAISIFGLVSALTRAKPFIIFHLILAVFTMVVCAFGAVSAGIFYWEQGYDLVKKNIDDDKCINQPNACVCPEATLNNVFVPKGDCDEVERFLKLLISEIGLAALGVILSFLSTLISMMAICCGPWAHISNYRRDQDHDYDGLN